MLSGQVLWQADTKTEYNNVLRRGSGRGGGAGRGVAAYETQGKEQESNGMHSSPMWMEKEKAIGLAGKSFRQR